MKLLPKQQTRQLSNRLCFQKAIRKVFPKVKLGCRIKYSGRPRIKLYILTRQNQKMENTIKKRTRDEQYVFHPRTRCKLYVGKLRRHTRNYHLLEQVVADSENTDAVDEYDTEEDDETDHEEEEEEVDEDEEDADLSDEHVDMYTDDEEQFYRERLTDEYTDDEIEDDPRYTYELVHIYSMLNANN